MHLHLYFHELLLTLGSSYFKLLGWISKEKAVMNTKNNDEQYFKWAVFAASHHKTIAQVPQLYQSCSIIKINTFGSRL